MRRPQTEDEYDRAHENYDRWLRERARLVALLADAKHESPERRDGLRLDIEECNRTIARYSRILES